MRSAKIKRFQHLTTKPTTDKQTNKWPTMLSETEYFPFKKFIKSPGQIRNQNLCRPSRTRYLQANLTQKAKKIEYIMKQGTTRD